MGDVIDVVVADTVWIGRVMAVVCQLPGIKTIAEYAFSCCCNPKGTVTVEIDIGNHLDFFTFFAILKQLPAFPVSRVEKADAVLGGYHQVVLVGGNVADNV